MLAQLGYYLRMPLTASLAFIDVETNGLGSDARIIEIAVVGVDEAGLVNTKVDGALGIVAVNFFNFEVLGANPLAT